MRLTITRFEDLKDGDKVLLDDVWCGLAGPDREGDFEYAAGEYLCPTNRGDRELLRRGIEIERKDPLPEPVTFETHIGRCSMVSDCACSDEPETSQFWIHGKILSRFEGGKVEVTVRPIPK